MFTTNGYMPLLVRVATSERYAPLRLSIMRSVAQMFTLPWPE